MSDVQSATEVEARLGGWLRCEVPPRSTEPIAGLFGASQPAPAAMPGTLARALEVGGAAPPPGTPTTGVDRASGPSAAAARAAASATKGHAASSRNDRAQQARSKVRVQASGVSGALGPTRTRRAAMLLATPSQPQSSSREQQTHSGGRVTFPPGGAECRRHVTQSGSGHPSQHAGSRTGPLR